MAEKEEKKAPENWKTMRLPDGRKLHVAVEGETKKDDKQDTNPKGGC